MATNTAHNRPGSVALLERHRPAPSPRPASATVSDRRAEPAGGCMPTEEPLLREALGSTLKESRMANGFTLRDLAKLANVSPGYLSELERGRKEVSSELLASVCHAMGVSVASIILEAASMMTLDAAAAELASTMAASVGTE
ncbi:Transcriptional regulator ClgR [Corynebacterium heidelbergense]|uniref:Transcriptional regulator n=2 Tax=Corynebacterium heidelbergense TaxID=2055947 RepID=A0A364VBX1_9CORY|nr:transcriptional regulator [Corynebacterium heidelbergense]WCZ36701.1 Transcriptional regulator ClgR [Corynebacterium heidelbergense]